MAKNISINRSNGSATYVTVGSKTWYFSYETCIAFENLDGLGVGKPVRIRRDQNYSVTTAKHMNGMGVKEWLKVDDAKFEQIAGAS